jgi:hypothetical protein
MTVTTELERVLIPDKGSLQEVVKLWDGEGSSLLLLRDTVLGIMIKLLFIMNQESESYMTRPIHECLGFIINRESETTNLLWINQVRVKEKNCI